MFNIPALIFPAFFFKAETAWSLQCDSQPTGGDAVKFLLRISLNVIYYPPRDTMPGHKFLSLIDKHFPKEMLNFKVFKFTAYYVNFPSIYTIVT